MLLSFSATEPAACLAEALAEKIKSALAERLPDVLFDQWFAQAEIALDAEGVLQVGVQNRFFKSRIETTYLPILAEAAEAALGRMPPLSVSVSPRLFTRFREEQEKREEEAEALVLDAGAVFPPPREGAPSPRARGARGMDLAPDFTFDAFVSGASNRLAHAVALRVVEGGGEFGRVLFCGQQGVGKTHLLQAVCRAFRERHPAAAVVYVTCERFVADFVAAHASGDLKQFRAGYRECDLLAIDQLQELARGNKAATQTELLAILDELQARGKPVLFASTLAPSEMEGVDARLRDRLGAGFVDRLSLPDESMRGEILVRKLRERALSLPPHLVGLVAREAVGNVRRLEGVVSRLAALIGVGGGMEATPACVRLALEMGEPPARKSALAARDIVAAVAEEYGLSPDAVTGRGRALLLRRARQVAVVLCRRLLGVRYAELGALFGGRSHATVLSLMRLADPALFSSGPEGRAVERVLLRLGVSVKPEELLERQGSLFPRA